MAYPANFYQVGGSSNAMPQGYMQQQHQMPQQHAQHMASTSNGVQMMGQQQVSGSLLPAFGGAPGSAEQQMLQQPVTPHQQQQQQAINGSSMHMQQQSQPGQLGMMAPPAQQMQGGGQVMRQNAPTVVYQTQYSGVRLQRILVGSHRFD
jgi:hypothetical protein